MKDPACESVMKREQSRERERAERGGGREELLKRLHQGSGGRRSLGRIQTSMSLVVPADGDGARLGGCRGVRDEERRGG
jgi:hypothetical protein